LSKNWRPTTDAKKKNWESPFPQKTRRPSTDEKTKREKPLSQKTPFHTQKRGLPPTKKQKEQSPDFPAGRAGRLRERRRWGQGSAGHVESPQSSPPRPQLAHTPPCGDLCWDHATPTGLHFYFIFLAHADQPRAQISVAIAPFRQAWNFLKSRDVVHYQAHLLHCVYTCTGTTVSRCRAHLLHYICTYTGTTVSWYMCIDTSVLVYRD